MTKAYLDPACGVQVELKQIRQGYTSVLVRVTLHRNVITDEGCTSARNQRLLAVRAHEGPCAAHLL